MTGTAKAGSSRTRVTPRSSRPSLRTEKMLLRNGYRRLAAIDEVGRGALAGPVTVGVVVITECIGRVPLGLKDSKLLTPAARESLVGPIRRWAGEFAVGHASAQEIDAAGIMSALRAAAARALAQLDGPVDAVLLDGQHNYLLEPEPIDDRPPRQHGLPVPPVLPVHLKVKADLTCAGVAAASVLAKTERDHLMRGLDQTYPEFQFAVNKGYATPDHSAALQRHGPSVEHRRSWNFLGNQ